MNILKKIIWVVGFGIIALIIRFGPISFSYSFSAAGQIFPGKVWVLSLDTDHYLVARTVDHATGLTEDLHKWSFERGDEHRFQIHPGINSQLFLTAGDTVGFIHSTQWQMDRAALVTRLAEAEAEWQISRSAAQPELVRVAEAELHLAETAYKVHLKSVDRLLALHKKGLAAEEEVDLAVGQAKLREIEIDIARRRLVSLKSGEKQTQVDFWQTRIEAIRRELETIQDRQHELGVTTPLTGRLLTHLYSDTLVMVADTSAVVAAFPLLLTQSFKPDTIQKIIVSWSGHSLTLPPSSLRLSPQVKIRNGEQIRLATVQITEHPGSFLPGTPVIGKFKLSPQPLWENLKHLLK